MFEVGFTEIILILGIALVVLGPEKLPKVAADIGRWVGRARAMARQLKTQLDEEVVKADRDWSRPDPPQATPRKSGLQDLDASPNRVAPPPAGEPPVDAAGAWTPSPDGRPIPPATGGDADTVTSEAPPAPAPPADADTRRGP
jgi:sec-independent protein translocase protein TatB